MNNASLCSLFSPMINLFLTSSVLSGGNGKSGQSLAILWVSVLQREPSGRPDSSKGAPYPRATSPSSELTVLTGYVLGEGAHAYCSFEYGKWQWGSCQADLICNFPRLPILKSFRQSLTKMGFVFNQGQ